MCNDQMCYRTPKHLCEGYATPLKTYTVVQTGNALCSTVHGLIDAVVANTSRTTAAELTPIILFALWQNFSIEMFGGNVALNQLNPELRHSNSIEGLRLLIQILNVEI